MAARYEEFGPVALDVHQSPDRAITVEADQSGIVIIREHWADPTEDEDMGASVYVDPDQAEQLAALLLKAAAAGRVEATR